MSNSRIVRLQAEKFLRLNAIDISPGDKNTIYITGKNGAGKSSVLKAIFAAFDLKGLSKEVTDPIHHGSDKASVTVELEDLVITRNWTESGNMYLKVTDKDGRSYKSPQAVLDKMKGKLTFDPLLFSRMDAKTQRQTLMELLGIDFSELEAERSDAYEKRTQVNSQLSQVKAQLSAIPALPKDTPETEISASDIISQIQAVQETNLKIEAKKNEVSTNQRMIAEMELQIKALQEKVAAYNEKQDQLISELSDLEPDSVEKLNTQLANIEETNKQVRLLIQKKNLETSAKDLKTQSDTLTDQIKLIDKDKEDALKAAKFPIPGMAFDSEGVLYQNVPFSQASDAEKIRVSLAMGIAMNPELKVMLIQDGSLMDSTSREIVEEMAEKNDMQLWIECVDESGECGVVISDGSVV